jgi:phage baseplate assembly protein W
MADRVLGSGPAFPFRVGDDGRIAWSSGEQNVQESIRTILQTEAGERLFLPTFGGGLQRFLFQPNTVTTRHRIAERIRLALEEWEPRIRVEKVAVDAAPGEPDVAVATITYRLVASGAPGALRTTVRLQA